ncbi:hypothetical protein CH63R_11319 [Colletotrichum higginsianum IMI 349063]|uniref:Apple domain-containing protein n=1 Tax=Colletotrichum higginsianum (strain IMI 349063) TaxID=759273 RepID=A0A1B7XXX3_COLHI|nr:hypothetical protein CH63R_11319 [Colletotrichum higginsianum IMI 349063]OBR04616.1 hypothetical protein CH63R_11319 [Colletotrichum higginsianum IMI 349063]
MMNDRPPPPADPDPVVPRELKAKRAVPSPRKAPTVRSGKGSIFGKASIPSVYWAGDDDSTPVNNDEFTFYREGTPPPLPEGGSRESEKDALARARGYRQSVFDHDEEDSERGRRRRCCGMRAWVAWLLVALVVAVALGVGIGVGVGVGARVGTKANQAASDGSAASIGSSPTATPTILIVPTMSSSSMGSITATGTTAASTASAASASTATGAAAESTGAASPPSSLSSSLSSSSPSPPPPSSSPATTGMSMLDSVSPTSTTGSSTTTASPTATSGPNAICPEADNTVYHVVGSDKRFLRLCGLDYTGDDGAIDMSDALASTMGECMEQCARVAQCTGVSWGNVLINGAPELRCWLKRDLKKSRATVANWNFAVLL